MGKFLKLFKYYKLETLKEFEGELKKLHFLTSSQIIAIIGIGGRFKGLPLIYVAEDEYQLKSYSARIVEILNKLTIFSNTERYPKELVVYYDDSVVFLRKITEDIGFLGLTKFESDAELIREWVSKRQRSLHDFIVKSREKTE
ncbi:MAG: hypothetical protein JW891_15865 [Candidatus Lokiarchaeota archaeon]|nr:hypothetical protein [Candidatus Lokiarchaeota archaeon]